MLPLLYPGEGMAQKVVEDPQTAPIPDLHKAMFHWVEGFTRRSWEMTSNDIASLRAHGLTDADIVNWAQVACLQTWWVMSADGGGIPLEGNAVTGPAVGRTREMYEASPEGLTAVRPGARARLSAAIRPGKPKSALANPRMGRSIQARNIGMRSDQPIRTKNADA